MVEMLAENFLVVVLSRFEIKDVSVKALLAELTFCVVSGMFS